AREPELDERIERCARLIQIVDPVVILDELAALPRHTRTDDERTRGLYDRRGDRGADLVPVVLAGHFAEGTDLTDDVAESEQPLWLGQVGCAPLPNDELAARLSALVYDGIPLGGQHGELECRPGNENSLQVVAKEEDAFVARCRDHIERVHGTLVQRETEFEVLDKEALAVVAELRQ